MTFDPDELKALAGVLITKGCPMLGSIIGGPIGPVLTYVIPQIATAFGLAPDATPAVITQAVAGDDAAADKLSQLEESHKATQEYINSQLKADQDLTAIGATFWQRFLVAGARPVMMWVSGPIMLVYQLLAFKFNWTNIPFDFFVATQGTFAGLAGVRTVEKWKGVASAVISLPKRK